MKLEEKRNKKQARQAYDDHKTARGEASSCVRRSKNPNGDCVHTRSHLDYIQRVLADETRRKEE